MHAHLDFETRSFCDLRRRGVFNYATDPTTEPLCLGYAIGDHRVKLWRSKADPRVTDDPLPEDLLEAVRDPSVQLFAHNAMFEHLIWNYVMVRLYGAPPIPIERWHCTAAMAAAMGLPRSLEDAAKVLGLEHQKDMEGHRAMLRLCKPNKHGRWNTAAGDFDLNNRYCKKDVDTERGLTKHLPPLIPQEREVWLTDAAVNRRGVPIDLGLVDSAVQLSKRYAKQLELELLSITGCHAVGGKETRRITDWLISQGVNLGETDKGQAKLDKTEVAAVLKQDLAPDVRRVLEIRSELAKSSIDKFKAMRDRENGGRVHDAHLYHGAGTGRWAGKGVQFQNVPRVGFKGDMLTELAAAAVLSLNPTEVEAIAGPVPDTLVRLLRSSVTASEGKLLAACDYSQIETRVLAWLAGVDWVLDTFRKGGDVYVEMASRIFLVPPDKVTDQQRQLGKIAVLGLGYGMGWKKFKVTCGLFGVELDDDFAQRVVMIYRESHAGVTGFWKRMQYAATAAVAEPGSIQSFNRISYSVVGRWLRCSLPSGRLISYCDPVIETEIAEWGDEVNCLKYWSVDSQSHSWMKTKTYGGKLVENIVQAVSRDILAAALVKAEARGYNPVFHVHDEIVCEIGPEHSLDNLRQLMTEVPSWAKGCPIGAAGFCGRRYRK
jgi:DNA polymerase